MTPGDSTPELSIISMGLTAQVSGASSCSMTATKPGEVQLGITAAGLTAAWLPDGWCPAATAPSQVDLTVAGSCTLQQLTLATVTNTLTAQSCTATTTTDTQFLMQLHLGG